MPFYALPTNTEDVFYQYLEANYTGSYPVIKAFSTGEYVSPMIMVKAGKFTELEPFTGVYTGSLAVSIITQVDDNPTALVTHDLTTGEILDLMSNQDALAASVNTTGNRFHLWGYYLASYDQDRADRSLVTIFDYTIKAQTLEV